MANLGKVRRSGVSAEEGMRGGVTLALVLLALVLAVVVVRWRPMAALPKSAPVSEFSGERALDLLRALEGDEAPHPIGSEANARVRERILAHLRWLGYAPEVQESLVCSAGGVCATAKNVLARLGGAEPGKGVLLLAHYDSVGAGPGAGDDMTGTAVLLETARVLKMGPRPARGVTFLITDGEEAGLLGAQAFVEKSPDFAEVGVVVNFEARGSSGPSLMFETSGPDGWLVGRWAAHARRPFTSSLFAAVYDAMPNDTDLTLFKAKGVPGLNFAFIGDPRHYHTPLDNVANASADTLQHHGDNALAAARAFADGAIDHPTGGKAVFFDLFRRWVVRWPAGLSPVLAALALVLVALGAFLRQRNGVAGAGGAAGFFAPLAAALLAGLAAYGWTFLLGRAFPEPFIASPAPEMVSFWLVGLTAALAAFALLVRRRAAFAGVWAGVWTFWSLAGLAAAILAPGVSFLFVAPALVAAVCGLAGLPGSESAAARFAAAFLPALAAAGLWFPVLMNLYSGLGLAGLLGTSLLLALLLSALAPLATGEAPFAPLGRAWLPALALAGALVAAFLGMRSAPFSPDAPRAINLALHQDADTGAARWLFRAGGAVPAAMAKAAPFGGKTELAFPWAPPDTQVYAAPAPRLEAVGPELTVLGDEARGGKRLLTLRLVSPRGAHVASLMVPERAKLEEIRVDGVAVPREGDSKGAKRRAGAPKAPYANYVLLTLPPQGSEIRVVLGETAPQDWYVLDRTAGLPPSGAALLSSRPKDSSPRQEGDLTILSRKVRL